MKKTALLSLGLATAMALGAAAPAVAGDHGNDWNRGSVAGAYAAAPGAVTGWYGGQNPNAREHQYTDSDGHTHYYGRRLDNDYYGNNGYYGNRYYNNNGYYDNGNAVGAGVLGAVLGGRGRHHRDH